MTALLTEFGNDSKDVLENIGHAEADAHETEDQRFNSFRQILDPLLRRRTSGWGIESQFFDLINLYRDLGRATGSPHQTNSIGSSNRRLGSSNQLNHAGSVDVSGDNNKECDKQRTHYASYCDMVRSLSFHITHLFQELEKIMLQLSRRRDDIVSVSPASKSVASTLACIALDHMNFGGHPKEPVARYLMSVDCSFFNDGTIDSGVTRNKFTAVHEDAQIADQSYMEASNTEKGNTTFALLAIAYGNPSGSEEDDQSDSDIAIDGDDLNTINHPLESKSQESPCLPSQFQRCRAAIPPVPVEVRT
ncbi:hypothetical protein KIW84_030511 [Lathyrus oleraceus]|uniref:Uncharacterized protein n=1 Tax=Pisum sativum TaxID=3888 RepID=A0A9D4XTB2_PEA|nr:hypothetical protein KIW84_030510 [Pisum sativum]KAI5424351.1 hypothetical protein KIW84_030511 [Pisum sativum]